MYLLIKTLRVFVLLFILIGANITTSYCQSLIDSLEQVAKTAKPGWDQVDIAVGLARLYIGGPGDKINGEKQIAIIYKNAEEQNIPEARAYGLIMENIIGNNITNDSEMSIAACKEAMKIAREYKCNDALVFAGDQLAQRYRSMKGDYQKSKETLEEIFPFMDETVDPRTIANAKRSYGVILTRLGEPEEGFRYMLESIDMLRKLKADPYIDPKIGRVSALYADLNNVIQYALTGLSESKLRFGAPEEARQYMAEALQLAIESKRTRIISWQYERFGMHYEQRGYYEKALENFQQSRMLLENTDFTYHLARSNYYLAKVMMNMKDYETAQDYLKNSMTYFRATADSVFLSEQLLLNSRLELRKGNLAESKEVMQEVELFVPALRSTENNGLYHQTLGEIALESNNTQDAIGHFIKALGIYEEDKLELGVLESETSLVKAYKANKDFEKAEEYGLRALEKAYTQSNIAYIRELYLSLSDVYAAANKYDQALKNYKFYTAFNDSVYSADAQVMLKEEQVRRNVVGIETQKAIAEASVQALTKTNQLYLVAGIVLTSILLLSLYLYLNLRKAKVKIEEKNKERETLLKEIHHRVKNNLQIISSILSMQSRKLEDSLAKSAVDEGRSRIKSMSLIHEKLYSSDQLTNVKMKDYIEELSGFLFNTYKPSGVVKQKINVEDIDMDIDTAIPVGLILNELISNALKYAFSANGDGELDISLRMEDKEYVLQVSDSGKGLPLNFTESQNMGMRLVNVLTEQLDGLLKIENEGGAHFTLKFKPSLSL
ncbi:histidine kinase dimerization/phosphoacceptor domain -containing protein [Fulvivirga sp.]|uniref:histidine kinase dimerization/phosphoacceptor domain -containing protein n=1 Tax=Fulvivirga sp. TaxID=1931237 RepID=UPI0032EBD157